MAWQLVVVASKYRIHVLDGTAAHAPPTSTRDRPNARCLRCLCCWLLCCVSAAHAMASRAHTDNARVMVIAPDS